MSNASVILFVAVKVGVILGHGPDIHTSHFTTIEDKMDRNRHISERMWTPTAGKKRPGCWPANPPCSAATVGRNRLRSRWLPVPPLIDRDPPPRRTPPSAPSLLLGRPRSLPPPPSPPGFKNTQMRSKRTGVLTKVA